MDKKDKKCSGWLIAFVREKKYIIGFILFFCMALAAVLPMDLKTNQVFLSSTLVEIDDLGVRQNVTLEAKLLVELQQSEQALNFMAKHLQNISGTDKCLTNSEIKSKIIFLNIPGTNLIKINTTAESMELSKKMLETGMQSLQVELNKKLQVQRDLLKKKIDIKEQDIKAIPEIGSWMLRPFLGTMEKDQATSFISGDVFVEESQLLAKVNSYQMMLLEYEQIKDDKMEENRLFIRIVDPSHSLDAPIMAAKRSMIGKVAVGAIFGLIISGIYCFVNFRRVTGKCEK